MNARKGWAVAAAGVTAVIGATAFSAPASAGARVGYPGYVWATNVNVRNGDTHACTDYPSRTNCPNIIRTVSKTDISIYCQKRGQPVSDAGYSSDWWSYIWNGTFAPSGFISNVYIRGDAHLAGIPDCTW